MTKASHKQPAHNAILQHTPTNMHIMWPLPYLGLCGVSSLVKLQVQLPNPRAQLGDVWLLHWLEKLFRSGHNNSEKTTQCTLHVDRARLLRHPNLLNVVFHWIHSLKWLNHRTTEQCINVLTEQWTMYYTHVLKLHHDINLTCRYSIQ